MSCSEQQALPYHWIRLRLSGILFLDGIEIIVKNNSAHKFERFKEPWLDRLFIRIGNSRHYKDLQIAVSVESKQLRLIRIDARADWKKEPPSPEFYDTIISKYFMPYLENYNKQYKATLELEQGPLHTGRSNLPTEATTLFNRFVAVSLRKYKPPEWDSLYRFIHHCHAYKIKLGTSELIYFLRRAGFTEESSKQIAKVYAHGRNVLSFFKPKRASFQVYFD